MNYDSTQYDFEQVNVKGANLKTSLVLSPSR